MCDLKNSPVSSGEFSTKKCYFVEHEIHPDTTAGLPERSCPLFSGPSSYYPSAPGSITTNLYPPRFWLLLAATILYAARVFGTAIFGNVPLNDTLEAFPQQSATAGEMAALRAGFEGPWNNLNNIRTISSTFPIILVIIACLSPTGK